MPVRAGAADDAATLSFTYTPHLLPVALSPSSGPATGDTLVTVTCGAVAGAYAPTCRYGPYVVDASYDGGGRLICRSPTALDAQVTCTQVTCTGHVLRGEAG